MAMHEALPQDDALVCLLGVLETMHEEGEGWRADSELYDAKALRLGIRNLHPDARRDKNGRRRVPA